MTGLLAKPQVRAAMRQEIISMFQDGTIRTSGDGIQIDTDGHSVTISIGQEEEQIAQTELAPARPVVVEGFDNRFS